MEAVAVDELLSKNLAIVQTLEKKATMFSKSMLVLSLLDVIFGVLAIFCTSLSLTALFASATSLTAITIFGRVIQISKIRQLEKSLRTMNLVSIAWFVNKYKKYINKEKKIKMTKSTVLQKILTSIIAVFGVGGIVANFLPQFAPIASQVSQIAAICSEALAVLSGIWLSMTSDKVLTEEEVAAEKAKAEEKAKAQEQKKLESAKKLVSEYEAAKKLVEDAAKNETK